MDPLEDVLALLETRSQLSASLEAGGRWAVRFDGPAGVKFNAVRRGHCVLEAESRPDPIFLAPGDCYLLTRPQRFVLRSDPPGPEVDAGTVFRGARNGVAHTGTGQDVLLIGGRFTFGAPGQELLLDGLPPVIHVPAGTAHAETVEWALTVIEHELSKKPVASTLVAEHLAVVMLIHVLRLHLASEPHMVSGWLAGLADPAVAAALTSLHADPARAWTVADLAHAGAVSRSTLAARFKESVGQGPLEYLTHWRIQLAAQKLRKSSETISSIAHSTGYGSESAISTAFKRVIGVSPSAYRKHHRMTDSV
ncbi:AraC family transcriptional regulator [Streptomyces sp. NE06-03E]|uniref:AraC family transcriptional regulator n=1 Tax=unclassified Streptomyces TaxID=2593676 RepID=UPI0029BA9307|nr:AraC family transcriptional regulator [Streptomyces sp. NE06-03E]MDX3053960.1 AraC family transcriptional regulator [Streptomyces sp. NE06-03E]